MKTTKKDTLAKLNSIAKPSDKWLADAKQRIKNQDWLQHSQMIALKILRTLRAQGKSQKDLASAMGVSPQQVNKWVKGKENFTLDTITKIESALDVYLIGVPVETSNINDVVASKQSRVYIKRPNKKFHFTKKKSGKVISMALDHKYKSHSKVKQQA